MIFGDNFWCTSHIAQIMIDRTAFLVHMIFGLLLQLCRFQDEWEVGTDWLQCSNCASVLQAEARTLLDNPSILDSDAQEELLSFVDVVFTDEDNKMLDKPISDEDVKASLVSANRNSSPGSDGLTYLTYLTCWEALGHHLSEVLRAIVSSGKLPESMKNSFLVFSPKINKENSTRIKDKRKLSLLQTDFKILSGVLAGRLRKTEQHTISRYQFATGGKRISEAVGLVRDAIESVKPTQKVALYGISYETNCF